MKSSLLVTYVISVLGSLGAGAAISGTWEYDKHEDKMTGGITEFARLRSDNSLDLRFPYSGQNYGALTIRKKRGETNVILSVRKGQIPCHSFSDGCKVTVRFDKQPPQRFNAVGPSDSSTETIFIENEPKFITSARKARTILVQFTMFQAGEQILEFTSASPLEWGGKMAPPTAAKKK